MLKVSSKLNYSVIYSSITIHPQKPKTLFKHTVNAVKDQLLQEASWGCSRSAPRSAITAHIWCEQDRNRKSCVCEAGDQQLMLCAICHPHQEALFQPRGFQSFSRATSHQGQLLLLKGGSSSLAQPSSCRQHSKAFLLSHVTQELNAGKCGSPAALVGDANIHTVTLAVCH